MLPSARSLSRLRHVTSRDRIGDVPVAETALRAWLAGPRTWRGRTALHSQPGVFAGDASRYPAGLNSGATTICPRDVVLVGK
jgi:hypothetical protein